MKLCKKFIKCNRLLLLGFTAAFLAFTAFSLFYATDTWASDSYSEQYYQDLYSN